MICPLPLALSLAALSPGHETPVAPALAEHLPALQETVDRGGQPQALLPYTYVEAGYGTLSGYSVDSVEADVDLLADAENVIASTALMEDSRMSASISWEAPSLDDAVVEPAGDCDGDTPPNCNTPASLSSAPDFPAGTSTSPGKKKAGDKKALAAKGGAPGRYSIPRSLPSLPGSQRRVRTALALYQYQGLFALHLLCIQ